MVTRAGRQWGSTERTRAVFLDAAREVFAERGFGDASISEVVERAGASVGSLYHHFGGKGELFRALWERHHAEQQAIAAGAVAAARERGVADSFELFLAGSRAYLEATWARRDLVKIFQDGDTPPGFAQLQRKGGQDWIAQNFRLLGAGDDAVHRALVFLVTNFIGEARREVARARSEEEAAALVNAMIEVLARMRPVVEADFTVQLTS
ncbi:TetR/AcrR family transcriptional regulator [Pseudonocardia acaciae]|uniref:TetR/AcrR family transcriptional regulator n=1 Tax=Pseudonocardia acaciae TaxID=551276 RepID=UPI000683E569|nr:TetR/AcrR family transcriptional regulator [Pseudonocardia acaciae]